MSKKDILNMKSVAYYSGCGGIEIKSILYGIDDYVLCVSGCWNGKQKPHKLKIYYSGEYAYIKLHGYRIMLKDCIIMGA